MAVKMERERCSQETADRCPPTVDITSTGKHRARPFSSLVTSSFWIKNQLCTTVFYSHYVYHIWSASFSHLQRIMHKCIYTDINTHTSKDRWPVPLYSRSTTWAWIADHNWLSTSCWMKLQKHLNNLYLAMASGAWFTELLLLSATYMPYHSVLKCSWKLLKAKKQTRYYNNGFMTFFRITWVSWY